MSQRSLEQLTQVDDPAWPIILEWIAAAPHTIELLPVEQAQAQATLLALQVTTRSPLGAFALNTGGVLVDHGWLRLLGSGHPRLPDTLLTWNGLTESAITPPLNGTFVIAVDVLGGVFALNTGGLGPNPGVHYFAPNSLRWEPLNISHMDFVGWTLTSDLGRFYANERWPGWEQEIAALTPTQVISVYPFLWADGLPIAARSRRAISFAELWALECAMAQQLGNLAQNSNGEQS